MLMDLDTGIGMSAEELTSNLVRWWSGADGQHTDVVLREHLQNQGLPSFSQKRTVWTPLTLVT